MNASQVEEAARWALAPFDRGSAGEAPYQVQTDLQDRMQDLVGIVRTESEMLRALDVVAELCASGPLASACPATASTTAAGIRRSTCANLLTVSEAITRAAIERKESRGGHFRDDYPEKVDAFGKLNIIVRKGRDGEMMIARQPIPEMPAELKRIIEENR